MSGGGRINKEKNKVIEATERNMGGHWRLWSGWSKKVSLRILISRLFVHSRLLAFGSCSAASSFSLVLRVTVISVGGAGWWGADLSSGFMSQSPHWAPLCQVGLELRIQVCVSAHSQAVDKS